MEQSFDADRVAAHEKATWNRCASIYEATLVPFTQLGYALVAETGLVGAGKKVLDVGCGPGVFTARYARAGARVTGVDFSEEMVRVAKDQFPEIEFQVGDAEQLLFDENTFDVVVGVHLVHHLARPRTVFASISRVIKPGGHFVFSIPDQMRQASFGSLFSAVAVHHKMDAMPGGPLLMESDPAIIRAEVLTEPLLEAGWKFANLDQVATDVSDRIRATTYSNAEPCKREDGSYEFPDEVLFGIATKDA